MAFKTIALIVCNMPDKSLEHSSIRDALLSKNSLESLIHGSNIMNVKRFLQKASDAELWCFPWWFLAVEQSSGLWFEKSLCSSDVIVMSSNAAIYK